MDTNPALFGLLCMILSNLYMLPESFTHEYIKMKNTMKFWKKLAIVLGIGNCNPIQKITDSVNKEAREKNAKHEAAHGIIWFLFRDNWTVKQLTIDRDNLPDKTMNGALQISANFQINTQTSMERANEIFAIALAGMIGQNIEMINQNPSFIIESKKYTNVLDMFDISGCGGDFNLAKEYLPHLSKSFNAKEFNFIRFKIFDLVTLFQDHLLLQNLHNQLTNLLLAKGTLTQNELITFFDNNNFSDYIDQEDLDSSFYHQHG